MQIKRMADASLALAERRAGDLKVAVEKLGQEAPSSRQLFGLRVMGLIAPPRGSSACCGSAACCIVIGAGHRADRGIGTGHRQADRAPVRRRFGWPPAVLLGVILDIVALAILARFGRRRQRAARAPERRRLLSARAPASVAAGAPSPHPVADDGGAMARSRPTTSTPRPRATAALLDRLADHPDVHRVATGRVTPRMGAGRPVALISKVRPVPSGLSITINADGRDRRRLRRHRPPDAVAAFMAEQGWTAVVTASVRAAIARGVGRAARATGHGGTSLPGKVLLRIGPGAIARLARRPPRGQRARLGDQRQDDDRGAGGRDLRRARASRRCTTSPAPTWPAASPRRCSQRAATRELGLFEVDEFWLAEVAAALAPRAIVLGNLFRDQLDRYGELETIAERWAAASPRRRRRSSC